jgi:hypothetical protein
MLTYGSLGKWISSHGSSSQVRGVHVVNVVVRCSCCRSAAWAVAAGEAAPRPLSWPASPPVRPRDGVPAARGCVAEAAMPLEPPSSANSSASASFPAVERTGWSMSALACGRGTDHSTLQPNNWISRSRSVFQSQWFKCIFTTGSPLRNKAGDIQFCRFLIQWKNAIRRNQRAKPDLEHFAILCESPLQLRV